MRDDSFIIVTIVRKRDIKMFRVQEHHLVIKL